MPDLFQKCELFTDISNIQKEKIINDFHIQLRKFRKNDPIIFANEAVVQQLILVEGEVKSEMTDYNGKTIKIADMVAPKILAPGFLFGQGNLYPVSIIAKNKCSVIAIEKQNFTDTLLKYPELQINFLNIISNQTQFLSRKINFLSFKTIKGKIAHFLLKQSTFRGGLEIELSQSLTQLADLFGVARPSLSRALSDLQHDAVIKHDKNRIHILDLDALKAYLG
jgi:CRP-like cAMP-binding protein